MTVSMRDILVVRIHAASVRLALSCMVALEETVTELLTPLNASACPDSPVTEAALDMVPLLPPTGSRAIDPLISAVSKLQ